MSDKTLDEWVARANAALNELRERNEDLQEWIPKVVKLVEALEHIEKLEYGSGYGYVEIVRATAREALAFYRGEE